MRIEMAASLDDMKFQQKRKINELEDITNNNRYHGKKSKVSKRKGYFKSDDEGSQKIPDHPQQQRSPSPSEASASSPPAIRAKSVSFDFSNDKAYGSSPLLTPKNDDDDFDEDDVGIEANSKHEGVRNLTENSDYIALTSSLRLLRNSKNTIENDISRLSNLQENYSSCDDKDILIDFFMKLINNEMDLPKPHKVINSPMVDWTRYHSGLKNVNKDLENNKSEGNLLFKTLNLFDSK